MPRAPTEDDIRCIYRGTIDDLFGFVSRRCDGDRALAEDITQETWLRAVPAWRRGGIPDRPLAWLSTVSARLLSNHFRRPAMQAFEDGTGDTVPSPDAAAVAESEERRSLVERALAQLPLAQTRLLEAFHFERRAVTDIASASGLSERAVEGRLRRARQNLRRHIQTDPDVNGDDS